MPNTNDTNIFRTAPLSAPDTIGQEDAIWNEYNPLRNQLQGHDSGWLTHPAETVPGPAPDDHLRLALRCAEKYGEPILDFCCGHGRFAFPLAETGHEVVGVDYNTGFIELARQRRGEADETVRNRLEFIRTDARTLRLNRKFRLIVCLGASFQNFLTQDDQLAVLSAVHDHLEDDGAFLLHFRFRWWEFGSHGWKELGPFRLSEKDYNGSDLHDPIEQVRFGFIQPADNPNAPQEFFEAVRHMSWQELLLLLRVSGFWPAEVFYEFREDQNRFDAFLVCVKTSRWERHE